MSYSKTIYSGNYLETYEYEKAPRITARRRKSVSKTQKQLRDTDIKPRSPANIRRLRKNFIRLVRSNLTGEVAPAFLTLTMLSIVGIETASGCFNQFSKILARQYGSSIRYIAVPEFQKRGAVHYHCLVWGLPDKVINDERDTRYLQRCWAYGYVDIIPTDGSPKIAGYMAKYMQKSMSDIRIRGKRAYNASRNVLRPVYFPSPQVVEMSDLIFGTVDKSVLTERTFDTEWLGRCRYRLIRLIREHDRQDNIASA